MQSIEYIRTFSTLGSLQAAHQYRYRLTTEKGRPCIWLESRGLPCSCRFHIVLTCRLDAAKNFLRLLYENAVPPEQGLPLAQELLPGEAVLC